MKKPYNLAAGLTHRLRQLGLTALLAGGATVAAQAQALPYPAGLAVNTTGTYSDLGTTGTAITTTNTDDANSSAQDIGFSFLYNGTSFTQFVFNTNGIIRLGSAAPSTAALYYDNNAASTAVDPLQSTNAANVNLLMPFNIDLVPGSNTAGVDYRVLTSGTAPNRVCTIQWRNVADKAGAGTDIANATQYANFSFQLKLYETTNNVEFVYGTATASTSAAGGRAPNVGLKGSGLATGQVTVAVKSALNAWTTTTFQNANYGNLSHAITQSVLPDAGRTYRFVPAANDAGVAAIYTLGKIISPEGLPHAVRATVTNAGTAALTNLVVTLSVTGANTFTNTQTVASLAAGASTTVTFASYPATLAAGTNTVTVTVPADGNAANNSAAQQQLVSATMLSYIAPDQTTPTGGGVGYGVNAGILASKFTLSATKTIASVAVFLPNTPNLAGHTMYGVVLSSTGAILGRSADYVTTASDPNTTKTLTLTTPVAVPAGDFYAGIAQVASATSFAPVGLQTEVPTRTGAFYGFALAGGTPNDAAGQNFGRFMIEAIASTTTATSAALLRATSVYPNPSETGLFNLEVNGANAKQGLELEVTNNLGQRVYAGSARDNFTTQLDLSNLATGLYHLKVKNGDEYMVRQLSIAK